MRPAAAGPTRLGALPTETRALRLRIGALAGIAAAGAAIAIAVVADDTGAESVLTATGGSVTAPTRAVERRTRLALWPRTQSGWTIVLASTPKAKGRDGAVAVRSRPGHAASAESECSTRRASPASGPATG